MAKTQTPSKLELELKELVMQTRAGDKAAYALLLKTVVPLARRGAMTHLSRFNRASYAEDVTQDVLLAIHLKMHTYDASMPFLAWLNVVLKHKAIDFLRRNKVALTSLDDFEFWEPANEDNPEQTVIERDVKSLLGRLKPPAGDIIRDMKIDGYSLKELSTKYNMSESNIKVIVHRGLQKLADEMQKETAA